MGYTIYYFGFFGEPFSSRSLAHVARVAVKYVAKPVGNFVVSKAVPFLAKKATAIGTRIAAQAWTKGTARSKVANLTKHFNDHGKSLGYKTPFRYTVAAIRNKIQAPVFKNLQLGARAYLGPTKIATFVYKGKISSFHKPRPGQWNRW